MKFKAFVAITFFGMCPALHAAPNFWQVAGATPTPPEPPTIQGVEQSFEPLAATPTPVIAPAVQIPSPTPTPRAGLKAVNPTQAALFSVFVPGSGHVYAGEPIKGLVFAALFGVGLWQTIDNLRLVPDNSGGVMAKNETAGNLFGLGTLAAYGFGIQDAYNSAVNYNKRNYLSLNFGISPRINASLAYRF